MVSLKACFSATLVLLLFRKTQYQVESASGETHLKLLRDLLNNYKTPFMRPVNDTTQTVEVGIRFAPIFSSLDEIEEELEIRGMLSLKWSDYRLTWDPRDYGGINETNIPLSVKDEQKVWIPEVFIYECISSDFQSLFTETTGVSLVYTGEIHWYTLANTVTYCTVDNGRFPFDVQTCNITFTTWMYQSYEQTFYIIDDLVTNDEFKKYEMPNPRWKAKIQNVSIDLTTYDCESCNDEKQSSVRYKLKLTRGPSALLVLIYVSPCIVLAIMTTFVTCLPQNSDAPAYALTCVLTLFVYFIFMYSRLPQTGSPTIGWFLALLVFGGILSVVYAVFFTGDFQAVEERLKSVKTWNVATRHGATSRRDDKGTHEWRSIEMDKRNTDFQLDEEHVKSLKTWNFATSRGATTRRGDDATHEGKSIEMDQRNEDFQLDSERVKSVKTLDVATNYGATSRRDDDSTHGGKTIELDKRNTVFKLDGERVKFLKTWNAATSQGATLRRGDDGTHEGKSIEMDQRNEDFQLKSVKTRNVTTSYGATSRRNDDGRQKGKSIEMDQQNTDFQLDEERVKSVKAWNIAGSYGATSGGDDDGRQEGESVIVDQQDRPNTAEDQELLVETRGTGSTNGGCCFGLFPTCSECKTRLVKYKANHFVKHFVKKENVFRAVIILYQVSVITGLSALMIQNEKIKK